MGVSVEIGMGAENLYVLPSDRTTLWQPGVTYNGGIPTRETIYTTLSPLGGGQDDTAQIAAAITACTAGQTVKLNAGNYNIGGGNGYGVTFNRSDVTLRGSTTGGVPTSIFVDNGMLGNQTYIQFGEPYGAWDFGTSYNLSTDGVKGAYSVTLTSTPSLAAGEIVHLDQLTTDGIVERADGGWDGILGVTVWGDQSPPGHASRTWFSRVDRSVVQILEVDHVTGNTVYFTTPLHIGFAASRTAQLTKYDVTFIENSGIEDIKLVGCSGGSIVMRSAVRCWLKNVESYQVTANPPVNISGCFQCELRDSYIHEFVEPQPSAGSYLVCLEWASSDCLVENNIIHGGDKIDVMRCCGGGNVWGYNYCDDAYIETEKGWIESGLNATHYTTTCYTLFEGNLSFNYDAEWGWGNAIYSVVFRNHFTNRRSDVRSVGLSEEEPRAAVRLSWTQYAHSFVGNVLGYSGQVLSPQSYWVYQNAVDQDASTYASSWLIGWWKAAVEHGGTLWYKADVEATTLRDGNFDYISNEVRWHGVGGDVGDGIPATMPDSLYLSGKPSWWGAGTWPWVDPVGATKIYTLPAKARFDAM